MSRRALTNALALEARDFQTFLNQLMIHGANISIVDEHFRLTVPQMVWYLTPVAQVLTARMAEDGEVVYDVYFGQPGAAADPHEPHGSGLLVTVTDPAIEVRPEQYAFELRDTFGDIYTPLHHLLISPPLTKDQASRLEAIL